MTQTSAAEPPARRILAWMCVLIAVNQLGFGAVIPVLPLYAQSFDVSQTAIGLTVAVYGLARVLLSIPTGQIADFFGRRSALGHRRGAFLRGEPLERLRRQLSRSWWRPVSWRVAAPGWCSPPASSCWRTSPAPPTAAAPWASTRESSCSRWASGRFPAAFLPSISASRCRSWPTAILAALAAVVGWFGVAETRAYAANVEAHPAASASLLRQLRALAQVGFLLAGLVGFVATVARTGALLQPRAGVGAAAFGAAAGSDRPRLGARQLGRIGGDLSGGGAGGSAWPQSRHRLRHHAHRGVHARLRLRQRLRCVS